MILVVVAEVAAVVAVAVVGFAEGSGFAGFADRDGIVEFVAGFGIAPEAWLVLRGARKMKPKRTLRPEACLASTGVTKTIIDFS